MTNFGDFRLTVFGQFNPTLTEEKITMANTSMIKKIIAAIFVGTLVIGFVKNGSYNEISKLTNYLSQKDFDREDSLSISSLESEFSASLINQKDLINLNGSMAKALGMKSFYKSKGVYVNDQKYVVSAYAQTSTDYEYEETVDFKNFLESNGINLLYVNEPTKYVDDSVFTYEFGIETYSNRNMDLFLNRIREAGVNTIDLRDNIREEGINVYDLFYRTDHHWTTSAGLWATQIMAEGLNDYCGYDIDTSIYNIENYNVTSWENCWLGEQGRLVAETYIGLDDYSEIKPNFETDYTFKNDDGTTYDGTFDNFVSEKTYNLENDVYENGSWHYSYNRIDCINNNVENGKILLIGDSFDHVTIPFLSLAVHEIDSLILRSYDESFSLRDYILRNGYDTVIVAYAQFMVGAHDNSDSANYRMFSFEY